MSLKDINATAEQNMQKAVSALERDFRNIRTGRANPQMLENVKVDYYGTMTSLLQVGNVSVPEPQLITIVPWEKKLLGEIEKAIHKADLGLNPQNDGNSIRIPIQPLSEDRRKDLVKKIKKMAEDFKGNVRIARRDANTEIKNLEKNKEISQDELKSGENDVQKLTDKYIGIIDKICQEKEQELLKL